jgi:PAS domain-containing protein
VFSLGTLARIENENSLQSDGDETELDQLRALSHLIKASTEKMEVLSANLQETEQRYQSLFDHNPDVVYSMNLNGKITSTNPSLTKMLGYSQEEILGTSADSYLPEEDRARVIAYFKEAVK